MSQRGRTDTVLCLIAPRRDSGYTLLRTVSYIIQGIRYRDIPLRVILQRLPELVGVPQRKRLGRRAFPPALLGDVGSIILCGVVRRRHVLP